jgi:cell wall-associated NlpC family hydrolase
MGSEPGIGDIASNRDHARARRWWRARSRLAVVVVGVGLAASACLTPVASSGPPPPPAGGAAVAVAYAEAQLGAPYCSGGTGPTCFDCSGLTMRAWRAGGLVLPHFSGAQYAMFPRVALSQLRPGDLVFPSDPNQHVGIYIGSGLLIHATKPGDVVRLAPLSIIGITLAVRPT